MQNSERAQPVPILFDSSVGDAIDQVLALAIVLASSTRREARLAALTVSRNSLDHAAFCELMVRFYRGEQPGTTPDTNSVPIGMFAAEATVSTPEMIEAVLNRIGPDGRRLYPRGIEKFNDTADPVAVLRNGLSAQRDQTAVVVLAGPPVNLLGLLAIPDGPDLVRNKVRSLMIASGAESDGGLADLLNRWPSPVIMTDPEMSLVYPARAIEEDFTWAPDHPVVDAYRSAGIMPYDTSANAMAAVLYALYPDDDYFRLSDPRSGNPRSNRQLMANTDQHARAEAAIRDLVSSMPPEPARRPG